MCKWLGEMIFITLNCSTEPGKILKMFTCEEANFHIIFSGWIMWKIYAHLYPIFLATIKMLAKLFDLLARLETLPTRRSLYIFYLLPNSYLLSLGVVESFLSAEFFLKCCNSSCSLLTLDGQLKLICASREFESSIWDNHFAFLKSPKSLFAPIFWMKKVFCNRLFSLLKCLPQIFLHKSFFFLFLLQTIRA